MSAVEISQLEEKIKANQSTLELSVRESEVLIIKQRKFRNAINELEKELLEIRLPWKEGDIVEDETGTRYRVTGFGFGRYGNRNNDTPRPEGIRLTKGGAEAYKDARIIQSNKLRVITYE